MAIFNVEEVRNAPLNNVVDAGVYLVKILKAESTASKQKHTPEIAFEYEIEAADQEQIDGRMVEGKHLFDHIYFPVGKPNTVANATLKKLAKAAEVEIDDDLLESLVGREMKITIKHEMYQGEPQERVAAYAKA